VGSGGSDRWTWEDGGSAQQAPAWNGTGWSCSDRRKVSDLMWGKTKRERERGERRRDSPGMEYDSCAGFDRCSRMAVGVVVADAEMPIGWRSSIQCLAVGFEWQRSMAHGR
jgi:hypothetical protein